MFKQVLRGLSVIALIVMVLTACGTTATPAATQPPAPTTAPAATQPPVAAATTAPVATTAPADTPIGTAATTKWCSGVNIVFFPGGPAGGVFAVNVYNGAVQAAADLGAKVDYVWSNWDPQTMIQQFQEAAATKPDGIAVMGHPGDTSFDPLIDAAEAQGIIVTSQNTELPTAQAKYAAKGFGYVGAVNYDAGSYSRHMRPSRNPASKQAIGPWSGVCFHNPAAACARKASSMPLRRHGMTVDYIEIDSATNADPTQGTATFTGYVSSHPDVKLIVTDHGGVTATVGTYLQAAGKKPGDIFMAGFDMSPATVDAIKSGYENLVIDQQEWLQGYLPILQICLTKVYGFSGLDINTGAGFVTKNNVAFIAPLANEKHSITSVLLM